MRSNSRKDAWGTITKLEELDALVGPIPNCYFIVHNYAVREIR